MAWSHELIFFSSLLVIIKTFGKKILPTIRTGIGRLLLRYSRRALHTFQVKQVWSFRHSVGALSTDQCKLRRWCFREKVGEILTLSTQTTLVKTQAMESRK